MSSFGVINAAGKPDFNTSAGLSRDESASSWRCLPTPAFQRSDSEAPQFRAQARRGCRKTGTSPQRRRSHSRRTRQEADTAGTAASRAESMSLPTARASVTAVTPIFPEPQTLTRALPGASTTPQCKPRKRMPPDGSPGTEPGSARRSQTSGLRFDDAPGDREHATSTAPCIARPHWSREDIRHRARLNKARIWRYAEQLISH